ncbi:MAG: hypothetical protein HC858_02595 [Brachymonas sp.]|nr:hypothetical protein [Brachymonas sp.]
MTFKSLALCAALAASVLLTACGGSNDPAPTASANCKDLTYGSAVAGSPFTNGQKVCFEATSTALKFDTKNLTSPVQNTAVTAPNAAYIFVDGSGSSAICYEVVFVSSVLKEINVGKGASCTASATFNFQGQFQ